MLAPLLFALTLATTTVDETVDPVAPSIFAQWLTQCAAGPRCSCLMHGVTADSETLFTAFPSVAFFVLLAGPTAQQLSARLSAAKLNHVYVLRADLQTLGSAPMKNDVVNPTSKRLSALEALRVSNEFFDLQIVTAAAPKWLRQPSVSDAKAILSLSAWTLVLMPASCAVFKPNLECAQGPVAWHKATEADSSGGGDATASIDVAITADGCDDNMVLDSSSYAISASESRINRCVNGPDGLPSLRDSTAAFSLLFELKSLRRLNAHHYSCWHSPRCHQRMYVMDLPRVDDGADTNDDADARRQLLRRGWVRRVPRLHRVDDGTTFGAHKFSTLAEAWDMRGKDLGFDTGGMNLDTAIGLQLASSMRTRLAAQFLALPVGRDMMLWNIIVGRRGLYAIDQENQAFEDGKVPWGDRVWPYCISVRDCYEKALGALCARQRPVQPLHECFAALTQATMCPSAALPFPCANGCRASFLDCAHRSSKDEAFVGRVASSIT